VNAIYVVFKETKFMTLLRSERYGFIDFISNCGGLMGLFMGISILSIVEIFYYTTAFVKHFIFKLCFRNNRVHDLNQ
jgi:amiloride-sensitive sodium channel